MPQQQKINDDWFFTLSDLPQVAQPDFDSTCLTRVTVPHDWSVEFPFEADSPTGIDGGFLHAGTGWYRKELYISEEQISRTMWLRFDGVFAYSTVYLNGEELGFHPYGYFPALYNISGKLHRGQNVIAVRVDNSKQPQSRWFNGCGIFRDVWLLEAGESYITDDGIFVMPQNITQQQAELTISVELSLAQPELTLGLTIYQGEKQISRHSFPLNTCDISCFSTVIELKKPALWSPEHPHLYRLVAELRAGEATIDSTAVTFGVRKLELIPNVGMRLNGEPCKMKGVCLHHDVSIVGAAATSGMLERRLRLLKDMGCNAIRTTDLPFGPAFYDHCDRLGIMVMNEAFDGWETPKVKQDYGIWFRDFHQCDLTAFIRRDRNHPSVIIWSIGNEVVNATVETTLHLKELVHKLDPSRPVSCGVQGTGQMSDDCRAVLDIAGYNDGGGACFVYQRDHERRPEQLMVATESPHTLQTRGFYRTQTWWRDKNQPRKEIDNLCEQELFTDGCEFYHSSYDNAGVRMSARDCWNLTQSLPYLIGEFRWSGWDYYGEALRWPARSLGYGIIDTANIPKDHYYLYQSMWVDRSVRPVLHMLPHWTHSFAEGTIVPICIYTNCDVVELLLNGKTLGKKAMTQQHYIQFDVPYEKGTLAAMAYDGNRCVKMITMHTADVPSGIKLEVMGEDTADDTTEPWEIRATIEDMHGTEVPNSDNVIAFWGTGVKVIGTENGDHADLTPLTSPTRKAFYGKCIALAEPLPQQKSYCISAAGILGTRYFEESTAVTISVATLSLGGTAAKQQLDIYYRLGNGGWHGYTGSFTVRETTRIDARVYCDNLLCAELTTLFIQGRPKEFVDLIHGNRDLNSETPLGPFSAKLQGCWRIQEGGLTLDFKPDGQLLSLIENQQPQKLGYWWYDFPVDALEAQEYAGTGEIWFSTGERQTIQLVDQSAECAVIDNRQFAISTAYLKLPTITLKKV